jgi:hypothetical protein
MMKKKLSLAVMQTVWPLIHNESSHIVSAFGKTVGTT